MITRIEIRSSAPFVGGAIFGSVGPYIRVDGVAIGTLDPTHPANRGIALLERAPRNAEGLVEYRSGFIILRPAEPDQGNGRLLYEVNNRGRIMLFANLCGGAAGNQPTTPDALGNALPLIQGFTLVWSGWDPAAPAATGLSLEAPVIADLSQPIREEFVSGTRLGVHTQFRLSYEATACENATVTVRRTQTTPRTPVRFRFDDARTIRLSPDDLRPEPGSIYEVHYTATKPPVLGIGFAATRDLVSHIRNNGTALVNRPVTHALAFGISQAGRYLRDHIAQGFNRDEVGARVFDGVYTHVAGNGRIFLNTPFGQPFRTRTWHEDRDFPEAVFPFSATTMPDPLTGVSGALMQGDDSDPKLMETNTSTEYWQKGASLLHTDPKGQHDVALPSNVRGYLIGGTQHGGKAGMPRDQGPCRHPRNWHDPMAAVRALLTALDAWVATGREPPASRLPRIADGTLAPPEALAFPAIPGVTPPPAATEAIALLDWTVPRTAHAYRTLVPQVDADGNERGGILLPDIAVPVGTFTGWNCYAPPYPDGELADRDGSFLAFADTDAERGADPRASLAARYPEGREARVTAVADELLRQRLLLAMDAARYGSVTRTARSRSGNDGTDADQAGARPCRIRGQGPPCDPEIRHP